MGKAGKRLLRCGRLVLVALTMLLLLAWFCHGVAAGEYWLGVQFGPAVARAWQIVAVATLALPLSLLVVTLFLGRVYCSLLCPLGILQDLIGWIARRRGRAPGNYPRLRYGIALVTAVLLLCNWSLGLRLLDPYSRFGGMAATLLAPWYTMLYNRFFPHDMLLSRPLALLSVLLFGLLPLLLLIGLVVWRRRFYCTAICPVGTVLGLCAKPTPFPLAITSSCVHCGQCEKRCPAGCIDLVNRVVDNERCLRCYNCLDACRFDAIGFRRTKPKTAALPATETTATATPVLPLREEPVGVALPVLSRRELVLGAAGLGAAAWAAGSFLRPAARLRPDAGQGAIYPPGAGSAARFASLCTGCQLCVRNCRGNVLRAAGDGRPGLVHLVFDRGMCEFTCRRCSTICPTGALRPMELKEKQRCRIGMAHFDPSVCIAVQDGVDCGACAEHCPTGALQMTDDGPGRRVPSLNPALCIGCGSCEYPCPVRPLRAMRVMPVAIQVRADDPGEYFRQRAPKAPAPAAGCYDGWLL